MRLRDGRRNDIAQIGIVVFSDFRSGRLAEVVSGERCALSGHAIALPVRAVAVTYPRRISVVAIVAYVAFVGPSASVVRADDAIGAFAASM